MLTEVAMSRSGNPRNPLSPLTFNSSQREWLRPIIRCGECHEFRFHAARGLCERCYKDWRRHRQRDEELLLVDPHTPGISRHQRKVLKGFSETISGLEKIGASREQILEIRRLLEPNLGSVLDILKGEDVEGQYQDNGEPTQDVDS